MARSEKMNTTNIVRRIADELYTMEGIPVQENFMRKSVGGNSSGGCTKANKNRYKLLHLVRL